MQKILPIISVLFLAAIVFQGCEKGGGNEVIVHDTVYMDYDIFTYRSTGEDENGDMVIFRDPNYPDTVERYELFLYDWEYFNEIRVKRYVFMALSTGNTLNLLINGERIGESITITDDYGDKWQYLELQYNTTKKADVDVNQLIRKYRKELGRR